MTRPSARPPRPGPPIVDVTPLAQDAEAAEGRLAAGRPRITVVTATLNPGPSVLDAVDSVAAQAWPDLQHLVVDGGSTDGSFEALQRRRAQFAALVREPDEGISDAWNKALRLADGDIVGLVSADDRLLPGALRRVASAFAGPERPDLVHGRARRLTVDGRERDRTPRRVRLPLPLAIWLGTPVDHPATFVRRDAYRRIGGFDTRLRVAMDYDLVLRAWRAGLRLRALEAELVACRAGGLSDRQPLRGFDEVLASQLAQGLNPGVARALHAAKVFVRRRLRGATN